ncbi:hypothetical protein CRYUN_Cryun30bG0047000 [Craigia yunnanensis]
MREKAKPKKMEALGLWLMLVGSLRLASVWFGFFDIWALRLAVFSNTTSMVFMRKHAIVLNLFYLTLLLHEVFIEVAEIFSSTFYCFYCIKIVDCITDQEMDINYMDAVTVEFTSTKTYQAFLRINSFTFRCFNLNADTGILGIHFMSTIGTN